jgi:hypothetical protein
MLFLGASLGLLIAFSPWGHSPLCIRASGLSLWRNSSWLENGQGLRSGNIFWYIGSFLAAFVVETMHGAIVWKASGRWKKGAIGRSPRNESTFAICLLQWLSVQCKS